MKISFFTLGCKVNQYESEVLISAFKEEGFTIADFDEVCDVYVINTCTVTKVSDKKSRQMIHKARKQNKDAVIAVVGCYPQANKDEALLIEGVDIVMGTKNRLSLVRKVKEKLEKRESGRIIDIPDIMAEKSFEALTLSAVEKRTRANLKIEDGCENFCSYCIIPYARGPIRSKAPEIVLDEIKTLVQNGYLEIVLTGIHLASYGKDLQNTSLLSLLKEINDLPGEFRIRLGSLEPTLFTKDFVEEIKNLKRLCPHFHLSLQSGCDQTLQRMNRKYTSSEYEESVKLIRSAFHDAAITTDIMVGFPGETEEEFLSSLSFVKKIAFAKGHIFAYSIREGTKAAKMPNQLSSKVKTERSHLMIKETEKSEEEFLRSMVGKTFSVLFEQEIEKDTLEGTAENYANVIVSGNKELKNTLQKVKILRLENFLLYGELI